MAHVKYFKIIFRSASIASNLLCYAGLAHPVRWIGARAPIQRAGCARLGGKLIKGKRKIAVWLREITES